MSALLSPRAIEMIRSWGDAVARCPECGEMKVRQPRCPEHIDSPGGERGSGAASDACADCRYYEAHFEIRGCKDHFEIELRHNALEAQEEQAGFSF